MGWQGGGGGKVVGWVGAGGFVVRTVVGVVVVVVVLPPPPPSPFLFRRVNPTFTTVPNPRRYESPLTSTFTTKW